MSNQTEISLAETEANPVALIRIWFDGGCQPNPGEKYGSFEVEAYGERALNRSRVRFGPGTNNEAEFEALEMALKETLAWMGERGEAAVENRLEIFTDSKIVLNRLMGVNRVHKKAKWAEASSRMFALAERALALMRQFESFEVKWRGRAENVQRFGH